MCHRVCMCSVLWVVQDTWLVGTLEESFIFALQNFKGPCSDLNFTLLEPSFECVWGLTVCTATFGLWSVQDTRSVCLLQEGWSLPGRKIQKHFFLTSLTPQANTPYMCESWLCVVYCAFWTLVSTRYKISWHTSKRQHPRFLLGKKEKEKKSCNKC